jgi:hypothetical protein
MMKTTNKRLEAVERYFMTDDGGTLAAIFINVTDERLDAPPPVRVDGWNYNGHEIRRRPGELDDDLQARAIAEVKPMLRPGAVPCFLSICH